MRRGLLALATATFLAACSTAPRWSHSYGADNPKAGTIHELATGREIGERELLARLARQDFVLVGEVPGNDDQARLAADLVGKLARRTRLGAVALESLPTDTQPLIVEYLAAHPRDARGLDQAIKAAAPDRPNLAQFSPALAAAVAAGTQVVAVDLSATALRAVLTHGYKALQPDFVRRTGLVEPFATPVAQGLRQELATASCGRAKGRELDALARARRARDATMADRLAAVTGRGQSLLLAADSHVRTDRGVPWYLRQLRPQARIASLAFVELDGASAGLPSGLAYDFVWLTPSSRPPGYDGCAAMPPESSPPSPESAEARGRLPSSSPRAVADAEP